MDQVDTEGAERSFSQTDQRNSELDNYHSDFRSPRIEQFVDGLEGASPDDEALAIDILRKLDKDSQARRLKERYHDDVEVLGDAEIEELKRKFKEADERLDNQHLKDYLPAQVAGLLVDPGRLFVSSHIRRGEGHPIPDSETGLGTEVASQIRGGNFLFIYKGLEIQDDFLERSIEQYRRNLERGYMGFFEGTKQAYFQGYKSNAEIAQDQDVLQSFEQASYTNKGTRRILVRRGLVPERPTENYRNWSSMIADSKRQQ